MSIISSVLDEPDKLTSFVGACLALAIPLFFNLFKDIFFDYKKRKDERSYVHIQVVLLLDKFLAECAEIAWDEGYDPFSPEPDAEELTPQVKPPVFEFSLIKGEHKYLKPQEIYEIHELSILLIEAREELFIMSNSPNFTPTEHVDYFYKRRRIYGEIGLYAARLGSKICKRYSIKNEFQIEQALRIQNSFIHMNKAKSKAALKKKERKAARIMSKVRSS